MRLIVLILCVGVALSRPQSNDPNFIPIVRYDRNGPAVDPAYSFSYETGNGITHEEQGRPVEPESFAVQGSYSYTAPDGSVITVNYVADDQGFRPETSKNQG